jgi:hypothetical protein
VEAKEIVLQDAGLEPGAAFTLLNWRMEYGLEDYYIVFVDTGHFVALFHPRDQLLRGIAFPPTMLEEMLISSARGASK